MTFENGTFYRIESIQIVSVLNLVILTIKLCANRVDTTAISQNWLAFAKIRNIQNVHNNKEHII